MANPIAEIYKQIYSGESSHEILLFKSISKIYKRTPPTLPHALANVLILSASHIYERKEAFASAEGAS